MTFDSQTIASIATGISGVITAFFVSSRKASKPYVARIESEVDILKHEVSKCHEDWRIEIGGIEVRHAAGINAMEIRHAAEVRAMEIRHAADREADRKEFGRERDRLNDQLIDLVRRTNL